MRSPAAQSPWASPTYCVECGSKETLVRDYYKSAFTTEFICLVCGIGFFLGPSKRYQLAMRMFKEEAKKRVSDPTRS